MGGFPWITFGKSTRGVSWIPLLLSIETISEETVRNQDFGVIARKEDKSPRLALAGVAQWIESGLQTKESLVQFQVRAHAW